MKIFGAGMAGLIAGIYNPKAIIFERNEKPTEMHKALLRFRSDEVSKITGIKFKEVKVIKSIWSEGCEREPSPRLVAMYSKKNTGSYENRSIMDISTCIRFIAPENFYDLLVNECDDRINFGYEISAFDYQTDEQIISTLPLATNAEMLGYNVKTENNISKVYVSTFKIYNCDMYATIYYPDFDTKVYRASITGSKLIIESKGGLSGMDNSMVLRSFGIEISDTDIILKDYIQPMGKLTGINDNDRRVQIYKMSHDHAVFSLGRFALHKNILLDDVARDVRIIKEMMLDDSYGVSVKGRL